MIYVIITICCLSALISNLGPKLCGTIFKHDDDERRWKEGIVTLFDGAELGFHESLNKDFHLVGNDELSAIEAYEGNVPQT